jgi:hypothetical protein
MSWNMRRCYSHLKRNGLRSEPIKIKKTMTYINDEYFDENHNEINEEDITFETHPDLYE